MLFVHLNFLSDWIQMNSTVEWKTPQLFSFFSLQFFCLKPLIQLLQTQSVEIGSKCLQSNSFNHKSHWIFTTQYFSKLYPPPPPPPPPLLFHRSTQPKSSTTSPHQASNKHIWQVLRRVKGQQGFIVQWIFRLVPGGPWISVAFMKLPPPSSLINHRLFQFGG